MQSQITRKEVKQLAYNMGGDLAGYSMSKSIDRLLDEIASQYETNKRRLLATKVILWQKEHAEALDWYNRNKRFRHYPLVKKKREPLLKVKGDNEMLTHELWQIKKVVLPNDGRTMKERQEYIREQLPLFLEEDEEINEEKIGIKPGPWGTFVNIRVKKKQKSILKRTSKK